MNNRFILVQIFVGLFLASLIFIPKSIWAFGISSVCKNPNFYYVNLDMKPISGQVDTIVTMAAEFKWKIIAPKECLDTNFLQFEYTYEASNGASGTIGVHDFPGSGMAGNLLPVHDTFKTSPRVANLYQEGDTFDVFLKVRAQTVAPFVFDYLTNENLQKQFIVRVGTVTYACIDAQGKYACSKANKPGCSDTPRQCVIGACAQIKNDKCDQLAPSTCVNGIKEGTEQCDGSDFGSSGNLCVSLGQGFTMGMVKCTAQCKFDTSQCTGGTGGGTGNCGGTGQPVCPTGQTTTYPFSVPNPLQGGANTVAELVGIIVKWIFSIAIPIAVAVIVYSGILFLTSKGNPAQVTKARQMLQYAVIGLAVILIGSGFISLIKSILELGAAPTGGGTAYSCNYDTKTCSVDASGIYSTEADCSAACNYSAPKFSCNSATKQCSSDPQGNYGTLDACDAACNPATVNTYTCDENRGICYLAPGGAYNNQSDCSNNCPSGGI